MNKLIHFFLLLPLSSLLCIAQDTSGDEKGRFVFHLGTEYRITPIYPIPGPSDLQYGTSFTNIDKQNSGSVLNLGVEYFITKNLCLGFTNSIRYDLVNAEFTEIQGDFGIKKADYRMLIGYHFYLAYYFKIFKKGKFFVNAGASLLNRNSEFVIKRTFFDDAGNSVGTSFGLSDYTFSANKFSLGYKNGRGKLFLGMYVTSISPYFEKATRFNIPFVGCRFDIGKL